MNFNEVKNISRKAHNTFRKIDEFPVEYIEVNKEEFKKVLEYIIFLEKKLEENNISINEHE